MTTTRNNLTVPDEVKEMMNTVKKHLKKKNPQMRPTHSDAISEMFLMWSALQCKSNAYNHQDYDAVITAKTSLKKLEMAEKLGLLR